MTDRIDLDELTGTEEEGETETGNRGDWLWREEDGPAPAPDTGAEAGGDPSTAETEAPDPEPAGTGVGAGTAPDTDAEPDSESVSGRTASDAVPHVPRSNRDRPAGVPESSGGAGAGSGSGGAPESADAGHREEHTAEGRAERDTLGETGPHGGGIDDMTLAFTYRAMRRLADPAAAVADASSWADWIGIVGDVPAHVINKFQRDHVIDADFFNGSGTGPGERLAEIGPHSMFYAERMALVGLPGEDEPVAERADWEFVPLSEAAEGAGWELRDPDGA
jgi:hypothetical protein